MLFLFCLAILFIPIVIQTQIFKIKTIPNNKFYVILIGLFNIFLEFVAANTSFELSIQELKEAGQKCFEGAVGMLVFGGVSILVLLIIIIQQIVTKNK